MATQDVALIAAFVLVFGLVSDRIQRLGMTGTIVFVVFGLAVGPGVLDWVDLDVDNEIVHTLAELTLVLVLFTDASRIDLRILRRHPGVPLRLLGIGLPLMIGAGLGVAALLFDDLSLWEAGLVAVILAPTDAALGQPVVTNPGVPGRIRQALNVESGLNDGICVPVLAIFVAGAEAVSGVHGNLRPAGFWIELAAKAIVYGVLAGGGIGTLAIKLIDRAGQSDWMTSTFRRLSILAIPVSAFALAELIGGSGFIAAFVAGLAAGSLGRQGDETLFDFSEEEGELLGLLTWIIFGGAFVGRALDGLHWEVVVYAVLSLTVIRLTCVALSLVGSGFRAATVVFMGWFGPRGLASIVFAISIRDNIDVQGRDEILLVVTWTVLLSVIAHGTTALPGARWYGAHCEDRRTDGLVEHAHVPELRLRPRWRS